MKNIINFLTFKDYYTCHTFCLKILIKNLFEVFLVTTYLYDFLIILLICNYVVSK